MYVDPYAPLGCKTKVRTWHAACAGHLRNLELDVQPLLEAGLLDVAITAYLGLRKQDANEAGCTVSCSDGLLQLLLLRSRRELKQLSKHSDPEAAPASAPWWVQAAAEAIADAFGTCWQLLWSRVPSKPLC